jgi:hemoglobin
MKLDIQNRADIDKFIADFYKKAMTDEKIGYIFTEVAKIHVETHLPIICDFWENVLFQTPVYQGNPMNVHIALHQKSPLTSEHFERWVALFSETINELFEGELAERAKQRAQSIATVMQIKIHSFLREGGLGQ